MSYLGISIKFFVVYRIFTSMIGKKTNVPLVKKDLRDHKVIYLWSFILPKYMYGIMYSGKSLTHFVFAPFPLVICRHF